MKTTLKGGMAKTVEHAWDLRMKISSAGVYDVRQQASIYIEVRKVMREASTNERC